MPKVMEASLESDDGMLNPHFDEAVKILKQKKWRGMEFTKSIEYISFSAEIEANPRDPKDWSLHMLFVPDRGLPDHSHILFGLKDAKKIHRFLGQLIAHIEKLESKSKKRK